MQFDWQEYINNTEQFWQYTERFLQGLKKHNLTFNELAKCEIKSRTYMQKCIDASDVFLKNFDKNGGGGHIVHILSPVHADMVLNRLRESFGSENIWVCDTDTDETNLFEALSKPLSLSVQYGSQQYGLDFEKIYADELDCMTVLQDAVIKSCFGKAEEQSFYEQLKEALWLSQKDRLLEHIQDRQNMLKNMASKPTLTDQAVNNLTDSIRVYLECERKYPHTIANKMLGDCDEVLDSIADNMEDYIFTRKNLKIIQGNLKTIADNMQQAEVLKESPVLKKTR